MKFSIVVTAAALLWTTCTTVSAWTPQVEHHIVYHTPYEFTGHPANEGMWQWGDEILVGFNITLFKDRDDTHSRVDDAPSWVNFARSMDGGKTWQAEFHPEISRPARLNAQGQYVRDPVSKYPPIPKPQALDQPMDFTHPDFALKVRNDTFYCSTTRGRTWLGPFTLPDFGQKKLNARTNYLVVDARTCRLFLSADYDSGNGVARGRSMMIETTDGGLSFNFITWLSDDPLQGVDEPRGRAYSIMPGVLQLSNGSILAGLRWNVNKVRWIELIRSDDQGRSWQTVVPRFEDIHNPVCLVSLGGTRLAMIYGWRNEPYGIYTTISEDNGRTWGKPVSLRDDARKWDIGYPRVATLTDGRILIVYYYTTEEHPANHIAATIWTPPNAQASN